MLRHGFDEMKGLITVTSRKNPTEIGIASRILHKQQGPVLTRDEFRTDDGLQSMLARDIQKADCAIESIGVGEGEIVLSL
jgi:hypothetical protein